MCEDFDLYERFFIDILWTGIKRNDCRIYCLLVQILFDANNLNFLTGRTRI